MSRTGWIALCTVSLIAFGVAGAAESPFGSAQLSQVPNGGELPPAAPAGIPPSAGTWEQVNALQTTHLVPWGDRLAASFEGSPGLWLRENGSWQLLTSVTPQHLIVACRGLVASFPGFGVYIHDGNDWIPLNANDPWSVEAWGDKNILIDFGPGTGVWNYECPPSITCAFLDGATWAVVDVGREFGQVETDHSAIKTEMEGDLVILRFYEDEICDEENEIFLLNSDCEFFGEFQDQFQVGPECTAFEDDLVSGRFTEDGIEAISEETSTYTGVDCPPDSSYSGVAIGRRCDAELCWPCDEPF